MSEKKFFGTLTEIGEINEANAMALGVRRKITEMGVCDGNGVEFMPDRNMRELPGLKRRAPLNSLVTDEKNPAWVIAEQVIPESDGGFWIRGYGLYDEDGDLVAVANCPPSFKPVLSQGSGKTQTVRMVLMVGSVATYELRIDPSVVLATREYVDEKAAKKLDVTGTAAAAKKLDTARRISISGAGKAQAKTFNGETDIDLKLDDLDVSKASSGTLDVARGGTGLDAIAKNQVLVGNDSGSFIRMTPDQLRALLGVPKIYSLAALPNNDIGPIVVAECAEVWIWAASAAFTGYRSPLCGRPVDGHTVTPLASEVEAEGGIVKKAAYRGLWGYAQENGLVVPQATWAANRGAHYFVDVDAASFRLPDLRDMFRRFTGTDIDTAGERRLAARQLDAMQRISGRLTLVTGSGYVEGAFEDDPSVMTAHIQAGFVPSSIPSVSFDSALQTRTSPETRPINTAYHPRIHV